MCGLEVGQKIKQKKRRSKYAQSFGKTGTTEARGGTGRGAVESKVIASSKSRLEPETRMSRYRASRTDMYALLRIS